ncbi:MAG: ABC-2 family transporter protein [Planctomycetes bacterium]|jgi:ABC-2 type transport system permease protein|nr:ABC-2 family transporter protein [Planctomycetota bacterium]
MNKYFKVWKQLSACAIGSSLSNRLDSSSYLLGKLVRFGFFLLLIHAIFAHAETIAGYTKYEAILFFLTFNLMDVIPQAFFRGIYLFRNDVRLGNFDFVLTKPVSPLFYSLTRLTDILDMLFLLPTVALLVYTVIKLALPITLASLLMYLAFVLVGNIIILGIHIFSACVTIWTMESENFIWFYRESMTIGRFPPEVYSVWVQWIFTLAMPVIVVAAFPAKVMLGALSWPWMLFTLFYTALFFSAAMLLWKISLKKYSSASS